MEYTAAQVAGFLNGTVDGNADARVSGLSKIEGGTAGTLTFLANPKYTPFIYTTAASVVIVNRDFQPAQPVGATLIRVDDAYAAFATLLSMFNKKEGAAAGVSERAFVDPSARLGENVSVGPFAFIGRDVSTGNNTVIHPQVFIGDNVTIGSDTTLYPGARILHDCVIGSRCIVHAGAVIGSDGFGFAPVEGGTFQKIPQLGNVVLEDDVEIGSNTAIDRATIGSTIIRKGVKLDNLIQVAHNAEIGENTVIAAQTGISGSTKIGRNCMVGGQAGLVGHINIADGVRIGAGSGVEADIPVEGSAVLGAPAIEAGKARRNFIHWRNLDAIVRKVYAIEKQLNKKNE